MATNEPHEWKAKVANWCGFVRGRVPSPVVRMLGARVGDYLVFNINTTGKVTLTVRPATGFKKKKVVPRSAK